MFPTLHDLAPWLPPLGTHEFFVALGLAAAGIVFLIERRRRGVTDPRIPYLVLGALAGAALLWFWLRHRPIAAGETLTLYIAAYGLFRFFVEFVRGNEIAWVGFTRPQLFLMVTIPILLVRIAVMARRGAFGAGARQAEASTPAASAAPTPVQGSDRREQPA